MKFSKSVKLVIALSVLIIALAVLFYIEQWAVLKARANSTRIDIATVNADGPGYTFADNIVTIIGNGYYTITGTTNMKGVVVQSGLADVNITLSGVDINLSESDGCAFSIMAAKVNLTLVGENRLISGYHAGLLVPPGATLVITENSKGFLTAVGGYGAGIGGGDDTGDAWGLDGGNITIMGGTVRAIGGEGRAGIGGDTGGTGGRGGAGGNITIGGNADVTAIGGSSTNSDGGAGIGGGAPGGASGNITITGNAAVTALGGSGGTLLRGGGAGVGSGGGGSTAGAFENVIINNAGRRDFKGGAGGNERNGANVGTGGSYTGPGEQMI